MSTSRSSCAGSADRPDYLLECAEHWLDVDTVMSSGFGDTEVPAAAGVEAELLAMLMHASATAGMLILQPIGISGVALLVYVVGLAAAYWAILGVVAVATRGRLCAERQIQGARACTV